MSALHQTYVAIVDDDESLCRSLGRLLRAAGIQPVTYLSAESFLADGKRPSFDCLVLDVQMDGMTGIELHQQLNLSGSKIPVIYITAYDEPDTRREAQIAGCAAYFRKTAPGETVLQAIRLAAKLDVELN